MASIEVDEVGLSVLARHCETQAVHLQETAAPFPLVDGFQPSSAAVDAAHAGIAAASARLAARMRATAVSASAVVVDYVSAEHAAATSVAALGGAMAV
jgi:hypothetical protein